eukprot:CAMPEP_0178933266 /NCGR_PEP_ID=MMETSP0786-20121207/23161_1 /TAXON_ID=186022 /ORGANISM="Thalassionema frauenfeldii, Strain CCMP 1798" /LENGTH=304 /DNA_ID=CAMNT_0020610817 /DNA_START=44 /DNA_END=955 /DNA_ORIENTATION=+
MSTSFVRGEDELEDELYDDKDDDDQFYDDEEDIPGLRVKVSFVNFYPKPITLYWKEMMDKQMEEMDTVLPYGVSVHNSYTSHVFVYESTSYTVEQEGYHHVVHAMIPPNYQNNNPNVICSTTKGDLHITVHPQWSPLGAARFLELIQVKYFDGCALNRVVKNFLTQFGIGANYEQRTGYRMATISDDNPPKQAIPFQPGYMSYAGSGPDSRTTEMFIVMPDTPPHQLEYFGTNPWETPFAVVDPRDVAEVVGNWYAYGDMPPWGQGPDPQKIYEPKGYDEYLPQNFPKMDFIRTCRIVSGSEET